MLLHHRVNGGSRHAGPRNHFPNAKEPVACDTIGLRIFQLDHLNSKVAAPYLSNTPLGLGGDASFLSMVGTHSCTATEDVTSLMNVAHGGCCSDEQHHARTGGCMRPMTAAAQMSNTTLGPGGV